MKADALPITKLYDTHNKAYLIPSYQREFAWTTQKATDLLEAVLEDAKAKAKLTSLGTVLFCEVPDTSNKHPLGNNAAATVAPSTIWEVVDGQQRLTVFAMIGRALEQRHQVLSAAGLSYAPPLEFEMFYATSRTKKGKSVPVLVRDGDNYDNGYSSHLAHLLEAFTKNLTAPAGGGRLHEVFTAISAWVADKLDASNFADFCEHLLSRCKIVQVEADDQDTAFTMFEPLNSTSEPLTAFEVYRSKAVRQFQTPFDQTTQLLDYAQASRDEVIKRSNTLIFTMAQAYSGERPRIHFVPLKQYLDRHVDAGFIKDFEAGAEFLRTIWYRQSCAHAWFDDEARNCVRFIKANSHDVALPLLMRYQLTQPTALPAVLKIVVAFFALWRAAFPTNKLPAIYRALLTKGASEDMSVEGGKTLRSPVDLATYFREQLTDRLGTPAPGQDVRDLWQDALTLDYLELKTICRLFVFLDISASIKMNLVPDDPWTSHDDLDHIHPVGLTPAPPNVHDVGNLTFLPSTVNKSLQNAAWPEKREVYTLLASVTKAPTTTLATGSPVPPAVQAFLADPKSPALAHLTPIAANPTWGASEITARTKTVLHNVWDVLFKKWLHP